MAVQTSYSQTHGKAYAGQVADTGPRLITTAILTTAVLAFGAVAVRGANQGEARPPAAGNLDFLGFVTRQQVGAQKDAGDVVEVGETLGVLEEGAIFVETSVAVSDGEPVYFTEAGLITNVSAGNTLIERATFREDASANELVLVRRL